MIVKNARNSLYALGCLMTLDLLINFEVNPNFISCGRISYAVGTLSNKTRGREIADGWWYLSDEDPGVCNYIWLLMYGEDVVIIVKILLRNRSRQQIPVSSMWHTDYALAAHRTPTIFPGAAGASNHNSTEKIYVDSAEICYSVEKADYIHGCCFWSHRKYSPAILIW